MCDLSLTLPALLLSLPVQTDPPFFRHQTLKHITSLAALTFNSLITITITSTASTSMQKALHLRLGIYHQDNNLLVASCMPPSLTLVIHKLLARPFKHPCLEYPR
ncbi:hypothetical protein FALCPG4_009723 [Fusarium falciforme]